MRSHSIPVKILVVEENPELRDGVTRLLTEDGYTVLPAAGPAEALELIDRGDPQMALVDLCLPVIDGLDLAWGLRAVRPGLPLVLMTERPPRQLRADKLAARFTGVVVKPIDPAELRRTVASSLAELP
jgi:CheY-like chemotaxis protein